MLLLFDQSLKHSPLEYYNIVFNNQPQTSYVAQTLSNKIFVDSTTFFQYGATATKTVRFDLST